MNLDLKQGRDELVTRRVNYHRKNEPPAVNKAYMDLRQCAEALRDSLSPEQSPLYRKMENAYSAADGESGRFLFEAGMQDAVALLFEGRDEL